MPKYSAAKSSKPPARGPAKKVAYGQKLVDRNLMGVSPLKEQFEPTDACPIRQHKIMAGMS